MRYFYFSLYVFISLLFSGCGSQWYVSTTNHDPMYDVYIPVDTTTKIDTINSLFHLKRKLRTDFTFRWNFAQYAMNQPYSFYWNNPRLDGIWRPYNRFDVYFNSHMFWSDWAWNYPWFGYNHPWYLKTNRYWGFYYDYPYGWNMWNHYDYSWYNEPDIAYVSGRRGSRNFVHNFGGNSNIEQDTNRRRNNRVYPNKPNNNNTINNVIRWSNDNNIRINVNSNPNRVDGTRVIIPNVNNNNNIIDSNTRPRYSRPPVNNNINSSPPPTFNRGSNSGVIRSGNSGGSSRGGRGKN